jgi:hypothetical protein
VVLEAALAREGCSALLTSPFSLTLADKKVPSQGTYVAVRFSTMVANMIAFLLVGIDVTIKIAL